MTSVDLGGYRVSASLGAGRPPTVPYGVFGTELAVVLDRLGGVGPYVLVGHSIGSPEDKVSNDGSRPDAAPLDFEIGQLRNRNDSPHSAQFRQRG